MPVSVKRLWGLRTEQRLQGGAALLEPVAGVGGGEEDGGGDPRAGRVQAEAHGGEQGLPARHAAHLVLHALLGRVHGVTLAVLDPLEGLLHLDTDRREHDRC